MPARHLLLVLAVTVGGCAHAPPAPELPPAMEPPDSAVRQVDYEDRLESSGVTGVLSADEVSGPFQRRQDDVNRCFSAGAADKPYIGGVVDLRMRIAQTGEAKTVAVVASTLGSYAIERCLVQLAYTLHFPKPQGGRYALVSYPAQFRAARFVESWATTRIADKVAQHRAEVEQCKARSRRAPSGIIMTLYIADGGRVTSAGLAARTAIDDALGDCLTRQASGWQLDDPVGRIAKATVPLP